MGGGRREGERRGGAVKGRRKGAKGRGFLRRVRGSARETQPGDVKVDAEDLEDRVRVPRGTHVRCSDRCPGYSSLKCARGPGVPGLGTQRPMRMEKTAREMPIEAEAEDRDRVPGGV